MMVINLTIYGAYLALDIELVVTIALFVFITVRLVHAKFVILFKIFNFEFFHIQGFGSYTKSL